MLNFISPMFSFEGRLSGWPFAGYWLLTAIVHLFIVLIGFAAFVQGALITALIIMTISLIFILYCGSVLTIKRLRDMGWSTLHTIWIMGSSWVIAGFTNMPLWFTIVSSIYAIGVLLWLILSPTVETQT